MNINLIAEKNNVINAMVDIGLCEITAKELIEKILSNEKLKSQAINNSLGNFKLGGVKEFMFETLTHIIMRDLKCSHYLLENRDKLALFGDAIFPIVWSELTKKAA